MLASELEQLKKPYVLATREELRSRSERADANDANLIHGCRAVNGVIADNG